MNSGEVEDPELLMLLSKRLFRTAFAFCNNPNPNDVIYLISACSSLHYHENYMDQSVKTMQSDEFHYCKLN